MARPLPGHGEIRASGAATTIGELLTRFMDAAVVRYRKDGEVTSEAVAYRYALRPLA